MKSYKEFGDHWFFGAASLSVVIVVSFLLVYQGRHVGLLEGLELLLYILFPFVFLCMLDILVHRIKFPKIRLEKKDKIAFIVSAFISCLTLSLFIYRVWP